MGTFIALMYHSLAKAPHSTYAVSLELFKTQLAWLQSEGWVIEGFDGQRLFCFYDNFRDLEILDFFGVFPDDI